jgi:hypothetical protein
MRLSSLFSSRAVPGRRSSRRRSDQRAAAAVAPKPARKRCLNEGAHKLDR